MEWLEPATDCNGIDNPDSDPNYSIDGDSFFS